MGDLTQGAPLLRIHSQCFTGEILGSLRCDCGDQLESRHGDNRDGRMRFGDFTSIRRAAASVLWQTPGVRPAGWRPGPR